MILFVACRTGISICWALASLMKASTVSAWGLLGLSFSRTLAVGLASALPRRGCCAPRMARIGICGASLFIACTYSFVSSAARHRSNAFVNVRPDSRNNLSLTRSSRITKHDFVAYKEIASVPKLTRRCPSLELRDPLINRFTISLVSRPESMSFVNRIASRIAVGAKLLKHDLHIVSGIGLLVCRHCKRERLIDILSVRPCDVEKYRRLSSRGFLVQL